MPRAVRGGWLDLAIRTQLNWSNLDAAKERELLRICQSGDDEASRRSALIELWESHSKLVVAVASRYRQSNIELVDLIGAGHLGLHAAIARFDLERFDSRLATYAIGWIRWHIQDYIRRNAAPVRMPATNAHRQLVRMAGRLTADARRSCLREGIEATESEVYARIGRRVGLDPDEVARSLRLIRGGAISLQGPVDIDRPSPSLEETLVAGEASPEEDVILRLDHAKARERMMILVHEILGERERSVFLARCIGDGGEVTHLETLAHRFGVTRERICQLEASAKRKIATALAGEGYGAFDAAGPVRLPNIRAQRRSVVSAKHRRTRAVSLAAG